MKSVLVIDDNADIRENTAEILDLAGYKTFTAENGKRGVDLAMKEKPDVIVCDIMMPELDGYGVLHLLRKNEETQNIPFIFLTAKTESRGLAPSLANPFAVEGEPLQGDDRHGVGDRPVLQLGQCPRPRARPRRGCPRSPRPGHGFRQGRGCRPARRRERRIPKRRRGSPDSGRWG